MQHEFLSLQRMPQMGFDDLPLDCAHVHLALEELVGVARLCNIGLIKAV